MKYKFLSIIGAWMFLSVPLHSVHASAIYVDQNIPSAITDGTYSSAGRDNSGTEGNAYPTIKEAIIAMNVGDTIILRGGLYREGHIRLPYTKNGSSWASGSYNTMISFPGEWAVLDGQNGGGEGGIDGKTVGSDQNSECVLGLTVSDATGAFDLKYWKFERLEIMNGASANGERSAGFAGNGGPFIFRYCYIHDNLTTARIGDFNPGGLRGEIWHDSLVEYCYFSRNGALGTEAQGTLKDAAHINIFSDYKPNAIAENGFIDANLHTARNEFRYNLFEKSPVGIKYKQDQFFTGRNPTGGHPYTDDFKEYGDKIHHNIFFNTTEFGTNGRQDFIQIYNNIFYTNAGFSLGIGENDTRSIYKAVTYNNTIISPTLRGVWRIHYATYTFMPGEYYGYDFNNILVNVTDGDSWCDIAVDERGTFSGGPDFTFYVGNRNYFYDPGTSIYDNDGTRIYWIGNQRYTLAAFASQYPGSVNYWKTNNPADPLFKGNTVPDRFKTFPGHVIEGTTTVANAGVGGSHPFLPGVNLPAYLGATNPNGTDSGLNWDPVAQNPDDSGWVDFVLYVVGNPSSPKNLAVISVQSN